MIYVLHTAKLCRKISCLSLSKVITANLSAGPAKQAVKISHAKERQTVSNKQRTHTIVAESKYTIPPDILQKSTPIISVNKTKTLDNDDTIDSIAAVQKKMKWKFFEFDATKLHKYCLMLSKARLTSLVVITAMGGYAMAPASFDPYIFTMCSLGTGLVSASANAINQFCEVPFDAQMNRTKNRVLVRGYLAPVHAAVFAAMSGSIGLAILYSQVNTLTAALGGANLILYTLIYTPMKRISILNTWIGSVVGAIPPLMGWAACLGDISSPGAWMMSGILYAWQFPHFNALSWNLRPDYSRAGYRMMAVTNPDLCRRTALRYTASLMIISYLAPIFDVTNWWFSVISTPLNGYFLYLAWQFHKQSDSATSRKLFRFSLLHLPVLMILMLICKKYWFIDFASNKNKEKINEEKHQDRLPTSIAGLLTPTSA
ncbi:protoheme IX farnesyltransferase, mitochondrial [Leptopilina heterotoma]|uniref:protoheme IX farnesyltransferase, mitochondrial n=1 Tax=Leptopilina heterotoma TaxID=63436 RepID=UPI001CA7EFC1|nr:protoheme IX farnesyltransferase, mitochondrial [Leptopilina heterotoma]